MMLHHMVTFEVKSSKQVILRGKMAQEEWVNPWAGCRLKNSGGYFSSPLQGEEVPSPPVLTTGATRGKRLLWCYGSELDWPS